MIDVIDSDIYHVFLTVLNELPSGMATLERDHEWGRSQLIPSRREAARLYGVGDTSDCEIGIVEITHSHFKGREEAIRFCRDVVFQGIEYTVWRDGDFIVRAQRHYENSPDEKAILDIMSALVVKPEAELTKARLKFEPYI